MFCNLTYSTSSEKEKVLWRAICCFCGLRYDVDVLVWLAEKITDAVLTTAVIDQEQINRLEVLPRQSGTISCFTRVVGVQGEPAVCEIAELENPVGQGADRDLAGSLASRDPGRRRQPA